MRILVTGHAGFIGSHVAHRLLDRGDEVFGFDNLNDYYDVALKHARVARLEARKGFNATVGDLADLLKTAIAEGHAGTITLKGPRALFDLLLARMPEAAGVLRHVEVEDLDLQAELDGAVLVTRISAFAEKGARA